MNAEVGKVVFFDIKLEDAEFHKIRSLVYQTAGISLADSKRALVVSRLARRLRQLNLDSFHPYIQRLESDPQEIPRMINSITTNLTKFFREKHQFEVLRDRVLPDILEDKTRNRDHILRIWSAGCATGEEAYSILFEVVNFLDSPHISKHYSILRDWKILGSDIDTNVLEKARCGRYSGEELKEVEKDIREKFFDRVSPGESQVKEEFRKHMVFRRINLVKDPFTFKHKIDVIFCRNVVIYFDQDTRKKLYEKFHAVLKSPGFFFSGHSENLFKYHHAFKFIEKSIYRKIE